MNILYTCELQLESENVVMSEELNLDVEYTSVISKAVNQSDILCYLHTFQAGIPQKTRC
jgi:hypothetical protein